MGPRPADRASGTVAEFRLGPSHHWPASNGHTGFRVASSDGGCAGSDGDRRAGRAAEWTPEGADRLQRVSGAGDRGAGRETRTDGGDDGRATVAGGNRKEPSRNVPGSTEGQGGRQVEGTGHDEGRQGAGDTG